MPDRTPLACRLFGHAYTYRVSLFTGALLSVRCRRCDHGYDTDAVAAHEAARPAGWEAPRA